METLQNAIIRPKSRAARANDRFVPVWPKSQRFEPPPPQPRKRVRIPPRNFWRELFASVVGLFSVRHSLEREVGPGLRPEFVERKEARANF